MTFDQLKEKALMLPLSPGVYIMRDKSNTVIYVGKAKKLKNRVSQYFQDTASHTPKTKMMVSRIHHFDTIVAGSEFEALVLECSLIKQHQPKYNILLKDDKGYPYIRIDMRQKYPKAEMVGKRSDDGAQYFGPFGSRSITADIIKSITESLKLPACSRVFPNEVGKGRTCLNFHMNLCDGWCQTSDGQPEYYQRMEQVRKLLQGNYKLVADEVKAQMIAAAEQLNFEHAAKLRDRLAAIETLGKKQIVTAGCYADTDVIGYAQTEAKACFAVLHYRDGTLLDKEYELLSLSDDPESVVSALMKQYYIGRGVAPKQIMLPFKIEDSGLFEEYLLQTTGRRTRFRVPERGDGARLVEMANANALEEAQSATAKEERTSAVLSLLGKMIGISAPRRIESYDISNISGTDIVASMVVFEDGRPKKSEYKKFKIDGLTQQDDYASMEQVIKRRLVRLKNEDPGFDKKPDLMLIDGGVNHAQVAINVQAALDISIPTFGMVKDDRHRTRALVTPDGFEIGIDTQPSVFALIGSVQEETHRFAISYHRKLRSKRLRYSELDKIPGIGPVRKEQLLKKFKSLSAISSASLGELEQFLPKDVAVAVYQHFSQKRGEERGYESHNGQSKGHKPKDT